MKPSEYIQTSVGKISANPKDWTLEERVAVECHKQALEIEANEVQLEADNAALERENRLLRYVIKEKCEWTDENVASYLEPLLADTQETDDETE